MLLLAALALLTPATASASPDAVIRDCARDGRLDNDYSNSELRRARDNLPADLDEYSDCRDVIASAIKGGSDLGGGDTTSPGLAGSNPAGEVAAQAQDRADLTAIAESDTPPRVDVGGTSLEPDSSGFFNLGDAANGVPLPLLLALILLSVMALASGIGALRERVPALARIPLLSRLPSLRAPFFGRRS